MDRITAIQGNLRIAVANADRLRAKRDDLVVALTGSTLTPEQNDDLEDVREQIRHAERLVTELTSALQTATDQASIASRDIAAKTARERIDAAIRGVRRREEIINKDLSTALQSLANVLDALVKINNEILQDGAEARRNLFYTANPNDPGKRVVSDLLDEILQQQYVASVVFRILFDMGIPTGNAVPALCDWLEVTGWGNAPSISLADAAALDADRAVAKLSRYTETQEAA